MNCENKMTVYRVTYHRKEEKAYDFFTRREFAGGAVLRAKERGETAEIEGPIEVPLTREGVLNVLQRFCSHAD